MRILICLLFVTVTTTNLLAQIDTDGDGLLDLIDVPGFNPNQSGAAQFTNRGIEDLDGANQLANLQTLHLWENQITSIEEGDFAGLENLRTLSLEGNQTASIEE